VEHTRNPNMGLELYRAFADAGMGERRVVPVLVVHTEFAPIAAYGVNLHDDADALVATGRLSRERADAAVAYLQQASDAGTFCAYGGMLIVTGQVPVD
jgi:hypothetical protein